MKLEEIKKAIEELTDSEKREFFSEIVPDICDEPLTIEGCRMILKKSYHVPGIWNPLMTFMSCRKKGDLCEMAYGPSPQGHEKSCYASCGGFSHQKPPSFPP